MRTFETRLIRLKADIAAGRFRRAALRMQRLLKYNPNWHLQPRVPAGDPDGGQWIAYLLGAAASVLPVLQRLGPQAIAKVKEAARRISPELRRLPRRWFEEGQPSEESYDEETRRIGRDSWQRRGEPNIRFRNEDELRRYLGPAGEGREWHHIVEKRLAGRPGFPHEKIHSTDNIISLPVEVHKRISDTMSSKADEFLGQIRHFGMEDLDFGTQYDFGLDLVERTLKDLGYDPSRFYLPVDTLVERFLKYQERQQAAIRARDIPTANRHFDKVKQYADALATTSRGKDVLEELTRSPLPFVRQRAAWRVLGWAPEIAVPVLGRHLIEDFSTLSIAERLELRTSARLGLYHFFGIRSYDWNDLIEPLKAYGIDLPYSDHTLWQ